jgi:predicted metal-dependent phosphoesterase TrpH
MYCDLHTHSFFSDGTYSPVELLEEAQRLGLTAIALTDHNTVAGLPALLAASENSDVEAVPGCEFSTDYHGVELHILGLFLAPERYETVTDLLEAAQKEKEQSNIDLVAALNGAGYTLDYGEICSRCNGQIDRAHIAAAMVGKGYYPDMQACFRGPLSPKNGFYHPPKRIGAYDCIRFIKSIGAVAVLAHPFLSLDEAGLREFLPEAVKSGLDGMEVLYSKYSPETTATAFAIADEFGLKYSGGSDFHGGNKPDIALGTGRGNLAVPANWLEQLKKR